MRSAPARRSIPAKLIVPPGVSDAQQRAGRPAGDDDVAAGRGGGRAAQARLPRRREADGVIIDRGRARDARRGEAAADRRDRLRRTARRRSRSRRSATALAKRQAGRHRRRSASAAARTTQTVDVKTIADPLDPTPRARRLRARPVGRRSSCRSRSRSTRGGVGGPSAGLAFALEVMEELGRNVDHGYTVAATGEIELNGAVGADRRRQAEDVRRRGRRKRTSSSCRLGITRARRARYAHGLRIIPVKSFHQALHALATLPPKR